MFLLNSLVVLTTLATLPIRAHNADKEAKIGMSSSTLPFFGIDIILETFEFLVLNAFRANAIHFLLNFNTFFSPIFSLIALFFFLL